MASRQQSAIEYLSTYGWAIVAIAVMLGVLYSLGLFGGGTNTVRGCSVVEGFSCTQPLLYSSGVLTAGIGQIGPTKVITATGCSSDSRKPDLWQSTDIVLASGQIKNVSFKCPVAPTAKIGTLFQGTLWVNYSASPGGGPVPITLKVAQVSEVVSNLMPPPPQNPITATESAASNQYNGEEQIVISLSRAYGNMLCFNASSGYDDASSVSGNSCTVTGSNADGALFGADSATAYQTVLDYANSGPVTNSGPFSLAAESAVYIAVRCYGGNNCGNDYISISLLNMGLSGSNCAAGNPLQDQQDGFGTSETMLYYCPDVPVGSYSVASNTMSNPTAYIKVTALAFPYR